MNTNIYALITGITQESFLLKNKYFPDEAVSLDLVCIFPHSTEEHQYLLQHINGIGTYFSDIQTGSVYVLSVPITTTVGEVHFVKIHDPQESNKQKGHVDFTVTDYKRFKEQFFEAPHFSIIHTPSYEALELQDEEFNVLIYIPNKSLVRR